MEAMSSTKAIASAIRSFSAKVLELREAYNELQVHSPFIASSLRWGDIEAYVFAAEKSITERFRSLESRARRVQLSPPPDSAANHDKPAEEVTRRPEIHDLCVNMKPIGLRALLNEHRSDLNSLQDELAAALRLAPNPAKIVLDMVEGVNPDGEELTLMSERMCVFILETLRIASPEIGPEEKQRAKSLAMECRNVIISDNDGKRMMMFLQLVGTFNLKSDFDAEDIMDIIVLVARRKLTLDICKLARIDEMYPALIHKMMEKNMHIEAVRYVYSLGLAQKIPPADILEGHIEQSKHVAAEILKKDAGSKKLARQVQVTAIKEVMRAIDEHKLVCHLTFDSLAKQIEELRRSSECEIPATKVVQKKQTDQANKRPRLSDLPTANLAAHCPLPSMQQQ